MATVAEMIEAARVAAAEIAAAARSAVFNSFSEQLQALPADQRFSALTDKLTELSNSLEGDQQTALNSTIEDLQNLDPQLQEALTNAVTYNPQFTDYLVTKMSAGDNTGLAGMLTNLEPRAVGPLSDVLNTIGNTPGYDTALLDNLIDTTETLAGLKTERLALVTADGHAANTAALDEQIREAALAQLEALKDAGGNVPALAHLQQMDLDNMKQFMNDLLMAGGGTEFAMTNLAGALGIEGEQLEAFMDAFAPFAGFMEFMIEPYAEVFQRYENQPGGAFGGITETFNQLTQGTRVESVHDHEVTVTAEVTESFEQPATTGNVVDFGEKFRAASVGEDLTDVNVMLDNLVEVDPELADEVAAIRSDADLMGQFTTWSGMMTSEEVAEASTEKLYDNINSAPSLREGITAGLAPAA